jgi:hypothetical protein
MTVFKIKNLTKDNFSNGALSERSVKNEDIKPYDVGEES